MYKSLWRSGLRPTAKEPCWIRIFYTGYLVTGLSIIIFWLLFFLFDRDPFESEFDLLAVALIPSLQFVFRKDLGKGSQQFNGTEICLA